jgi:two-component system cell cycle response regulator
MPPEKTTATSHRPRVLLVDDSRVIRRVISKTLADQFELIETEDGEQGWEALIADPEIEAVLTDVEMPRLDGHGLLARIRSADLESIREVPVIVITGADDEPARQRAYAHGATDFIIKPIDGVQLLARVHAQVRLDRATRRLATATRSLDDQAVEDPLTRLASHRFLLQRGLQDLSFARRHNAGLALIRFAIDDASNLSPVPDAAVVGIARLFRVRARREDTVARLGGRDFAVLLPSAAHDDAVSLAQRLCAEVASEPTLRAWGMTLSAGVASLRDSDESIEALLAIAKQRLRAAQEGGGNRVEGGDPISHGAFGQAAPHDINAALRLIANGEHHKLGDEITALTWHTLPLLELCNRRLGLGLGFAIESLKDKLARFKP